MPAKRFTTVIPLPSGVSRKIVLDTLQNHNEMIDLNQTYCSYNRIPPPASATPEEINCSWYQITDRITMCPGLPQKSFTFNACFHDLSDGSQLHCYAPLGLFIKQKWTIGGNVPGEPARPIEIGIGAPSSGLYIRKDVELKCNFFAARIVRHSFKGSLDALVARLMAKVLPTEAVVTSKKIENEKNHGYQITLSPMSPPLSVPLTLPLSPPASPHMSTSDSERRFPHCELWPERQSVLSESGVTPGSSQKENEWAAGAHLPENMMPVELPS
ncbi:hypothetical protein OnM2_052005 [Erysiphe neolycopersici]|uniref:DUF7053 domain-containing protein n=1 Tax=Erysiphe neolycopersici TaxID=212602 RepID=A0A420HS93_9PEZI|nr:hypothetical protein OnM2_052005 [Erysiphe neolycopersici]